MPATITHSYFTVDVYNILKENIKEKISLNHMKMFGQAFDPLKFYNLFSILPGKKIRKLDYYFHTHKSRDFFINMLKIMKQKNLITDKECCAFFTGFVCHYVLDSTIHPFVIYKTGIMDKKNPNTYKYNNIHAFMEAYIDNYMVQKKENKNPYKFRLDKFCFDKNEFSLNLDYLIDTTFYKTYQIKDMSYIYFKSLKQMRKALLLLRRDPSGIKKNIYKLVDTFTSKKSFRFEAISYHYPLEDKHNFLNEEHKIWRNPTTYEIESNESFSDLYDKSIIEAKKIIEASFEYLNGSSINLNDIFLNLNYITGLDCNLEKECKYFEF